MGLGVPVHFIHVRKAGGTAIKEALRPVAEQHQLILHPHRTKLKDIPKNHRFFFFVRHPLSRFVSGFYSRQRRGAPRYNYEWTKEEAEAFQFFSSPCDLAEALSSPNRLTARRARAAMAGISHVNSSFLDWFVNERELDMRLDSVVMIGLQEQLTADFEMLKAVLGLPQELRLPSDDVLAHRNPSNLDRTLTILAKANLRDWFAPDIRFFEHCLALREENFALPMADSSNRASESTKHVIDQEASRLGSEPPSH